MFPVPASVAHPPSSPLPPSQNPLFAAFRGTASYLLSICCISEPQSPTCILFAAFESHTIPTYDIRAIHSIYMGVSENVVYPIIPMVLLIIIPFLNGYFIGNIPNIFRQTHMLLLRSLAAGQGPHHRRSRWSLRYHSCNGGCNGDLVDMGGS